MNHSLLIISIALLPTIISGCSDGSIEETKPIKSNTTTPGYPIYDLSLSEEDIAEQKARLIKGGALDEATKNAINQPGVNQEKIIDLLKGDFVSWEHYISLAVYSSPSYSTSYFEVIEAGQELVKIAKTGEQKDAVVKAFESLIFSKKKNSEPEVNVSLDEIRGAAIFFIKQILSKEEMDDLRVRYSQFTQANKETTETGIRDKYSVLSYTDYYLYNFRIVQDGDYFDIFHSGHNLNYADQQTHFEFWSHSDESR